MGDMGQTTLDGDWIGALGESGSRMPAHLHGDQSGEAGSSAICRRPLQALVLLVWIFALSDP